MQDNSIKNSVEWQQAKRWNPFNSFKLLAQVERWSRIKRGKKIPPPALVTVDPTNVCNYGCDWCNASFIMNQRHQVISEAAFARLADFLPRWGSESGWKPGVDAVCVAGGGEPLLNRGTPGFIDRLVGNGVEVGVVTNGSKIHECVDSLSQCTWVGVSMDAGLPETYNKYKHLSDPEFFRKVCDNISNLVDYSKFHNSRLGWKSPAYGVSFKYLLYKENMGEVFQAAKVAKEIGCRNIHFRPAGTTWDHIEDPSASIGFSEEEVGLFKEQIAQAMALDDETFSVYGVTHKFTDQFGIANHFAKCHAVFMTAVIEPPSEKSADPDSFVVGLCCDRRGDSRLELARDITDPKQIDALWGSQTHWRIHDEIKVSQCPRCTYQPHNEIYEQVILNDTMTYKFI